MVRPFLLAVLLAGCTSGVDAQASNTPSASAAPAYEAIAFRISSWGRPIDSWEVRADGTATHAQMVDDDPSSFTSYQLEHREFRVRPMEYDSLVALAAELPQPRLTRDGCKERATDLPYGALTLTRGGVAEEISFDVGCLDAPYQAFVGKLKAMDDTVTALAQKTAPARIEEVTN